ncbi:MAG: hypothetical protein MK101_09090, partial [Phycisphaerales bacterium]|nr:hypothetical protein [Phycisphaerales bacterium]
MLVRTGLVFIAVATLPASGQAVGQEANDAPKGRIVENSSGVRDFDPPTETGRSTTQRVLSDLHPDGRLWYQHVQTLANPWFEGRQPGTRGDDLALNYIQWHMDQIGLEPAFASDNPEVNPWRQPFEFNHGRQRVVHDQRLEFDRHTFEPGVDFNTLANSGSASVEAPLSFAGYAIEEGPDGYSSFGERDTLEGRIAVMLRYEPLDDRGRSKWAQDGVGFSSNAGIRSKM